MVRLVVACMVVLLVGARVDAKPLLEVALEGGYGYFTQPGSSSRPSVTTPAFGPRLGAGYTSDDGWSVVFELGMLRASICRDDSDSTFACGAFVATLGGRAYLEELWLEGGVGVQSMGPYGLVNFPVIRARVGTKVFRRAFVDVGILGAIDIVDGKGMREAFVIAEVGYGFF